MSTIGHPTPVEAGRPMQLRLDESLTAPASHEMSTIDLSAAGPGRYPIGTMAGFRLESVADFVGIHIISGVEADLPCQSTRPFPSTTQIEVWSCGTPTYCSMAVLHGGR